MPSVRTGCAETITKKPRTTSSSASGRRPPLAPDIFDQELEPQLVSKSPSAVLTVRLRDAVLRTRKGLDWTSDFPAVARAIGIAQLNPASAVTCRPPE